jgi:hypothetical protein
LDGPYHTEQDAIGHPAPGAIACPCLPFEGLLASDLTPAQRACREPIALRCAPPAGSRESKAPQDRFVRIQQDDLAPAGLVLERRQRDRGIGEGRRGGCQPASGPIEAQRIFFRTLRTLSRPSWTPVCWARTVASSRQLHWDERAPCCSGSCSTRRWRCRASAQVILGGRPGRGRSSKP